MSMDFPAADIRSATTLPGAAMTKRSVKFGYKGTMSSVLATGLLALGTTCGGAFAAEPITQVNISHVSAQFATGVPQVAVSRTDPNLIAVAWRSYGLPINTNAGSAPGERTADCHVSVSTDGGNTFRDTNLMPVLRTNNDPDMPTQPAPGLFYCNWSWVTIGDDRTIYAGGAMFTALGDIGWPGRPSTAPKQGRALVAVSRDDGQTWTGPTFGIRVSHFAPGLTGLGCSTVLPCVSTPGGTDPWHTPWDNAMGVAAPGSTTFYSKAGNYVVPSDDRAQTFGVVHTINVPGWTFTTGQIDAAGPLLVAGMVASRTPLTGPVCPCLGVVTSNDKGATWTPNLIAQATEFNATATGDTARYPFAAIDPKNPARYAVVVFTPDHRSIKAYWTDNNGATWKSSAVNPTPTPDPVVRAGKIAIGYTTDGKIVVVWRGFQAPDNPSVAGGPGPFNTFAALLQGDSFGPTIRVSPESSTYPLATTVGSPLPNAADYNLNNGGGDFSTWITGNPQAALVAYPYAPGGIALDTYFARVPLTTMQYNLQLVPNVVSQRMMTGLITTVFVLPEGYSSPANLKLNGASPIAMALDADGRTLVTTFNKSALSSMPTGNAVPVSVTGSFTVGSTTGVPVSASTKIRVIN